MRRTILGCAIMGWAVAACGGLPAEESAQAEQMIIRGAEEDGRPQVVLLQSLTYDEFGQSWFSRCSGTVIAPRVILTAAHCAPDQSAYTAVYYGDDYDADQASFYQVPPPGEPSVWAVAQSWRVHPDWDPARTYPDIAVVYVDRELPIQPMAVGHWHVGRHWIGKHAEIVGWGANVALSADIQTNEGVGVKRSGDAPILGSPTAADYHPEDPHGGILDPEVQADLLKLDGRYPNPNGCAGDSGGPMILRKGRRDYVVGVSSWTGLWCEDYSLYTRTSAFSRFVRDSLRRAGDARIVPVVSCVTDAPDGGLRAYLGYDNQNGIVVEIPRGPDNALAADARGARPTTFYPGRQDFQFPIAVAPGAAPIYWLNPPDAPPALARVTASAPRCDVNDDRFICAQMCDASANACEPGSIPGFDWCVADCQSWLDLYEDFGMGDAYRDYARCAAGLTRPEAWMCDPDFGAFPMEECMMP